MLDLCERKVKGYDVEEIVAEYNVDEEGNKTLLKEKRTVKHVPPDLAKIKAYMEAVEEYKRR